MMTVLFWISALIVGYVYVGYPCLLAGWARIADRRPRRVPFAADAWPSISIVIAARNEAQRLPAAGEVDVEVRLPDMPPLGAVQGGEVAWPEEAEAAV